MLGLAARKTIACLLALLATVQAHPQTHRYKVGKPVNTTSGLIHGHPAPNATQVSEYLGIPFAQPPLGALRFAPPVKYHSSCNVSGAHYGHVCPQTIAPLSPSIGSHLYNLLSAVVLTGNTPHEDCLTVNVWTKPQTGPATKPVMVWIYGGAFDTGGTNGSTYSGQYWADEEDVVFVNFNYRLGIFGFPGGPSLTQNVALLDQRLAVEWVRDNIAAFGGDPDRIILFGESAGAASTDLYNYIWTKDPIIAGSITESGQANAFGNAQPAPQAEKWYQVADSLGCGDNTNRTASAVVACMRNVSMDALLNATAPTGANLISSFLPTIDNRTVFSNYTQLDIDGKFIQKPALVGNNDNEAGLFILLEAAAGITQSQQYWDAFTQNVFTCPSNTAAWARWYHKVPVWRYRYFPSFPNLQIPTSVNRAYHSAEILPLFNTDQDVSKEPSTALERKIGGYMRHAWASFAHCPASGLKELSWPEYSPEVNGTEGLVLLGRNNQTHAFSARGPFDGTCPLIYQGN